MILLQKYFDYDKIIKATIITYLNNILLYNYNKKKVDSNSLKFLNMKLKLQKELDNNKKIKDTDGKIGQKTINCKN